MGRGEERTVGRESLTAKDIEVEVWRRSESYNSRSPICKEEVKITGTRITGSDGWRGNRRTVLVDRTINENLHSVQLLATERCGYHLRCPVPFEAFKIHSSRLKKQIPAETSWPI